MIIYKITNLVTNKVYIGQTIVSIKKRWGDHCSKGSHCTFLVRSIAKHGKKAFKIEEIDRAETIEQLHEKEKYWISFYKSNDQEFGYNLSGGGEGGPCHEETKKKIGLANTGKTRTDEVKEIFRQNNLGRKQSPETIEKRAEKLRGKKRPDVSKRTKGKPRNPEDIQKMVETRKAKGNYGHSEEVKLKMSESHTGKTLSKETKLKMSEKMKGVPKSEEAKANMSKARKGIPTGRKLSQEEINRREDTKRKNRLERLKEK